VLPLVIEGGGQVARGCEPLGVLLGAIAHLRPPGVGEPDAWRP